MSLELRLPSCEQLKSTLITGSLPRKAVKTRKKSFVIMNANLINAKDIFQTQSFM